MCQGGWVCDVELCFHMGLHMARDTYVLTLVHSVMYSHPLSSTERASRRLCMCACDVKVCFSTWCCTCRWPHMSRRAQTVSHRHPFPTTERVSRRLAMWKCALPHRTAHVKGRLCVWVGPSNRTQAPISTNRKSVLEVGCVM